MKCRIKKVFEAYQWNGEETFENAPPWVQDGITTGIIYRRVIIREPLLEITVNIAGRITAHVGNYLLYPLDANSYYDIKVVSAKDFENLFEVVEQ